MKFSALSDATLRELPCLFIVGLAILFAAPFGLPGQTELANGLILGTVWYWSLHRPDSMKAIGVFLSGLIAELFQGGPPGVLLLWMLIAYGVAHAARALFAQGGFLVAWTAFAFVIFGETAMTWGLVSARCLTILPIGPALFEFCLGAGIYPLLTVFYTGLRRHFEAPS